MSYSYIRNPQLCGSARKGVELCTKRIICVDNFLKTVKISLEPLCCLNGNYLNVLFSEHICISLTMKNNRKTCKLSCKILFFVMHILFRLVCLILVTVIAIPRPQTLGVHLPVFFFIIRLSSQLPFKNCFYRIITCE